MKKVCSIETCLVSMKSHFTSSVATTTQQKKKKNVNACNIGLSATPSRLPLYKHENASCKSTLQGAAMIGSAITFLLSRRQETRPQSNTVKDVQQLRQCYCRQ